MTTRRRRRKPRVQASATARGYGYHHQQVRKALLAQWQPGDPCSRCSKPMWGPPNKIHLGHNPERTAWTGLEHAHCNLSEAATRGNRARMTATRTMAVGTVRHSRAW